MRHIYFKLYALFVVIIIIFTVGMFVFNIIEDTNKEIERAEISFHQFEKAISYELKTSLLKDEKGKQRLKNVARALKIKGFVLQIAPDIGTVFSYPNDSTLFSVVNGNVLIKEHSKFLKVFKADGYIDELDQKIYITVLMNILPVNMIFLRSRTVFFIVLALCFLTAILLIVLKMKISEKREKVYTSVDRINKNTSYFNEQNKQERIKKEDDRVYNFQDDNFINDEFDNDTQFQASKDEVISSIEPKNEQKSIEDTKEKEDTLLKTSSKNDNAEKPVGLYSPSTGVCWREYLDDRLDAELGKATATDQDISLVIVKILNVDFSTIDLKAIGNIMVEIFKFRDMIFEYSDNESLGFVAILQDVYVDEAVRVCNVLFSKLQHEIYLTGQEPTIKIGITTRACRLLSYQDLIMEANKAVHAAIQNQNECIIGFKPNAEKYRQRTVENSK